MLVGDYKNLMIKGELGTDMVVASMKLYLSEQTKYFAIDRTQSQWRVKILIANSKLLLLCQFSKIYKF